MRKEEENKKEIKVWNFSMEFCIELVRICLEV